MKAKISVVTITYNAEAVLQRTLDSVLSQSYPYVEHLIIDGASKDGTLALAEQYRSRQPWLPQGHSRPFTFIMVCPISPALPSLPV